MLILHPLKPLFEDRTLTVSTSNNNNLSTKEHHHVAIRHHITKRSALTLVGIIATSALLLSGCGSTASAGAHTTASTNGSTVTLSLYTHDQSPFEKWWIPAFEKKYPHIKISVVGAETSAEGNALFDRVVTAEQAHKAPPINMVELTNGTIAQALVTDGYTQHLTSTLIPRLNRVPSAYLAAVNSNALPYRGSSVVVGYNSQVVKSPPTTFAGVISWIKQHPGKFAYANPDNGGMGQAFIEEFIRQYVPSSIAAQYTGKYNPALEKYWGPGLKRLKALAPDFYGHGQYPTESQVFQLLDSGKIDMATVWSDGSLQQKAAGLMPPTIHLQQISPPLTGGPADLTVLKGSTHIKDADLFLNYMLSMKEQELVVKDMDGYPGIKYSYFPASIQAKYIGIEKAYAPYWSRNYVADLASQWAEQVGQ